MKSIRFPMQQHLVKCYYNMRWNKFLVTVQDEMNYIQNYVELMNLRYDFTITLSVQIPKICIGRISPRCLFSRLWKMQSHMELRAGCRHIIEIKGIEHERALRLKSQIPE